MKQILAEAINRMPEREKIVLTLYYYEGLDPGRDRPGPRCHREPGVPDPHQGRAPAAVAASRRRNESRPDSTPVACRPRDEPHSFAASPPPSPSCPSRPGRGHVSRRSRRTSSRGCARARRLRHRHRRHRRRGACTRTCCVSSRTRRQPVRPAVDHRSLPTSAGPLRVGKSRASSTTPWPGAAPCRPPQPASSCSPARSPAGSAVTVLHADGVRTTYGPPASRVVVGQTVAARPVVASPVPSLPLRGRDPEGDYLDPEPLFAGRRRDPPDPRTRRRRAAARPASYGTGEARHARSASCVRRPGAARPGPRGAMADQRRVPLVPSVTAYRLARELDAFARCARRLHAGLGPRATPVARRIAVLVGGIGTIEPSAAVDRGRHRVRLGYAPIRRGAVLLRGGRIPPAGSPAGRQATIATTRDSGGRHRGRAPVSASRLVTCSTRWPRRPVGVPVDVIAHSQGGVVARLAVDQAIAAIADALRPLGSVVTLATPTGATHVATGRQRDRRAVVGDRASMRGGARRGPRLRSDDGHPRGDAPGLGRAAQPSVRRCRPGSASPLHRRRAAT